MLSGDGLEGGADDGEDEAAVSGGVSAGGGPVVAVGGSLAEAAGGGAGLYRAERCVTGCGRMQADRGERERRPDQRRARELVAGVWSGRIGCSARSGRPQAGCGFPSPGRPGRRDEVSVRGGGACTVSCLGRHSAADTRRARSRCLSRPRRSTATTGTSLNAVSTPAIAGVRTLYGPRVASLRATVASGEHRSRFGRRVPPRCGVRP